MAVRKRKYRDGSIVWSYEFPAPGSSREKRERVTASGFSTKKEAIDAEATRRLEVQREKEEAAREAQPKPLTLSGLLTEFFADCGDPATKTLERWPPR